MRWPWQRPAPERPGPLASKDYFQGYRAHKPHPMTSSTGSEGRCDICGGYWDDRRHDKPWVRLTEAELSAEATRKPVSIPLAPAPVSHPWDTGVRNGQGEAGDYVAHVRELRAKRPPKSIQVGPEALVQAQVAQERAVEDRFITDQLVEAFGGKRDALGTTIIEHKEEPVKINFTVEVDDLMQGFKVAEAIRQAGGATLAAQLESEVTETHESSPSYTPTRRYFDGDEIVRALDKASTEPPKPVLVRYTSAGSETPRTRRVTVHGRTTHTAGVGWKVFDLDIQEPRTFVLSHIDWVEA